MTHVTRLPALVSLNQLTYQFANGETLLDALNLSFDRLPTAIVGRNGVGKSLLCLLYTSPSPRDRQKSRMPSSA